MKNKLETIFFSCCTDQIGFKRDKHHSPVALWRWKRKIPVQFDQNWLIQGLKRFQRYCYIFCVAAVVVCYELQQRAVCCVEHNFSFKESVPTTRHYKYKYQISMYRLILLFKSPLRRWILENVTDKYYFRVQSWAKFLLSKPRTLGTVGAPRRVGLLYCCVEKVPSMKQCAPRMTRGSAYGGKSTGLCTRLFGRCTKQDS